MVTDWPSLTQSSRTRTSSGARSCASSMTMCSYSKRLPPTNRPPNFELQEAEQDRVVLGVEADLMRWRLGLGSSPSSSSRGAGVIVVEVGDDLALVVLTRARPPHGRAQAMLGVELVPSPRTSCTIVPMSASLKSPGAAA
jgi:hypothetical protein